RAPDPAEPRGDDQEHEDEPKKLEQRVPLPRAALLLEGLERDLLEDRALPGGSGIRIRHLPFVLSVDCAQFTRNTPPFSSRTCSGSSEAPRHGPATQKPVPGSNKAPCVEHTKYRPVSSKNSPGC